MSKKYIGEKKDLEESLKKSGTPKGMRRMYKYSSILLATALFVGTLATNNYSPTEITPSGITSIELVTRGRAKILKIIGMSNREAFASHNYGSDSPEYKFNELSEILKGDYDELVLINSAYKQIPEEQSPITARKLTLINSILAADEVTADSIELRQNSVIEPGSKNILYLTAKSIDMYNSKIKSAKSVLISANNIFFKNSILELKDSSMILNIKNLAMDNSKLVLDNSLNRLNINDLTLYRSTVSSTNHDLVLSGENMQLIDSKIESENESSFIKTTNNMALTNSKISSEKHTVLRTGNLIHLSQKSILSATNGTSVIKSGYFEIEDSSHISGVNCVVKGASITKKNIIRKYEKSNLGVVNLTNEDGKTSYGSYNNPKEKVDPIPLINDLEK